MPGAADAVLEMRVLAALAVVCCLAFAWLPATARSDSSNDAVRQHALEQEVLDELNRVRLERGLAQLRQASGLRTAATRHSRAMVLNGFFAHESPDGTAFQNRIRRHYPDRGWATWSVAETILMSSGRLRGRAVVAAWLRSPPHRDVILSPTWREAGIGAVYRQSAPGAFRGKWTLVVTADFGIRSGRAVQSTTRP